MWATGVGCVSVKDSVMIGSTFGRNTLASFPGSPLHPGRTWEYQYLCRLTLFAYFSWPGYLTVLVAL